MTVLPKLRIAFFIVSITFVFSHVRTNVLRLFLQNKAIFSHLVVTVRSLIEWIDVCSLGRGLVCLSVCHGDLVVNFYYGITNSSLSRTVCPHAEPQEAIIQGLHNRSFQHNSR